jgi:selenide, water dikinase
LLSNIGTNEDASIFKINDDLALVQTLDFITPVVDDPFIFGQIAAANSLSDVFAMGGSVINALNIVGFDNCNLDSEILAEILAGGANKVAECGGVVVGGHTIETQQMYYGLSVTGRVSPYKFWSNNTACEGDILILTKPLGTGILSTAIKADLLSINEIKIAVEVMRQLNFMAVEAMSGIIVSAATDVTGFGFFGHLSEMLNHNISFEIFANEIPVLSAAIEMATLGIIPQGSYKNRDFAAKFVDFGNLSSANFDNKIKDSVTKFNGDEILLFDAQTSGGLLIAVNENDANLALQRLRNAGYESSAIVGMAVKKGKSEILIK